MTCGIYGLKDPFTGAIRYIGASMYVEARYEAHHRLHSSDWNKNKRQWVQELARRGVKPVLVVLEHTGKSRLAERENVWLDAYRLVGEADLNKPGKARWVDRSQHPPYRTRWKLLLEHAHRTQKAHSGPQRGSG